MARVCLISDGKAQKLFDVYTFLNGWSRHLRKILSMAQRTEEQKDVKIGRPRVRGLDLLRDPLLNKGMCFSLQERQLLGLHGLLPPAITNQDQQVYNVMQNFYRLDNDLDRYIYMMSLHDRNEKLFYRTVTEHVELMMPIIYTPTVGLTNYGLSFVNQEVCILLLMTWATYMTSCVTGPLMMLRL